MIVLFHWRFFCFLPPTITLHYTVTIFLKLRQDYSQKLKLKSKNFSLCKNTLCFLEEWNLKKSRAEDRDRSNMIASDRVGSCSFAAALKHDGGEKEKERGRGRFLSARFHILLAQILPLLRPNSVRWQMMASLDGELAENGRRGQGKEKRSGGNHRQGFGYNIFAGGSRRPRPRYCNRNAYRFLPRMRLLYRLSARIRPLLIGPRTGKIISKDVWNIRNFKEFKFPYISSV